MNTVHRYLLTRRRRRLAGGLLERQARRRRRSSRATARAPARRRHRRRRCGGQLADAASPRSTSTRHGNVNGPVNVPRIVYFDYDSYVVKPELPAADRGQRARR